MLERVHATRRDPTATNDFEAVENQDALQQALGALSADERETIALRYGADLTVPEIAKLLGEKASTIHGRVYSALRKLRVELDAT
jgi:RNA polymerase sigma-70 factor (ECF subfamily)